MAASELFLYGEVGWDFSARSVRDWLVAHPGEVLARIHSAGGAALEGVAIYTLLRERGAVTQVDGLAASAGSLIAMAGSKIRMAAGAIMMAHRSWAVAMGNADDMRNTGRMLDAVDAALTGIYARRLGKPVADVLPLLDAEVWLGPEDAITAGWADEIADGVKAPLARLNLSTVPNPPAAAAQWAAVADNQQEAPMGIAAKIMALVGAKPAEGETDEQTVGRLDALSASLGDPELARAAFLAGETAPEVVARIRSELAASQAALAKAEADLTAANSRAANADRLQVALTEANAKIKALAPGMAVDAGAAAESNRGASTPTAADYHAEMARLVAGGMAKNAAISKIATTRPDLVAALAAG